MLLHSSGAAKRIKRETSVPEDTVISGEGKKFEWSMWTCMMPLSFLHQGSLKCTSLLSVPNKSDGQYQKTSDQSVMSLWGSLIIVLCSHDECDCHAIENRIRRCLTVNSTVGCTQRDAHCSRAFFLSAPSILCSLIWAIPSFFSASSVSRLLPPPLPLNGLNTL